MSTTEQKALIAAEILEFLRNDEPKNPDRAIELVENSEGFMELKVTCELDEHLQVNGNKRGVSTMNMRFTPELAALLPLTVGIRFSIEYITDWARQAIKDFSASSDTGSQQPS